MGWGGSMGEVLPFFISNCCPDNNSGKHRGNVYIHRMFSNSRESVEALQSIRSVLELAVEEMRKALKAVGDDPRTTARLEDLELSRAKWEAQMEAVVLKADSTLKAANNAESRARTMVKHYEKDAPDGAPPGEEGIPPEGYEPPFGDGPPVPEEGVQPLRLDVETSPKNRALMAKFS